MTEKNNNTNQDFSNDLSTDPSKDELFAGEIQEEISAQEIFADKGSLLDNLGLGAENEKKSATAQLDSIYSNNNNSHNASPVSSKSFNKILTIMVANGIILAVVATVLIFKITQKPEPVIQVPAPAVEVAEPEPVAEPDGPIEFRINEEKLAEYESGISYSLAQDLFNKKQYADSLNVYLKLDSQLSQYNLTDEILKDFIALNIALCMDQLGEREQLGKIYTRLLSSKSPAIQLLTNYHLVFDEIKNHNFLEARKRAYRSLALLSPLSDYFTDNMAMEIYFTIAESLTNHILELTDSGYQMPGRMWARDMRIQSIPVMQQEQLLEFLLLGREELNKSLLGPKVETKILPDGKTYFNLVTNMAPLNESLAIVAGDADINLDWGNCSQEIRVQPITMVSSNMKDFMLCEILCGYNGLIPIFSENNLSIYNPDLYTNLNLHKQALITQSMSLWRKFLVQHHDRNRIANAHFAMAKLHELSNNLPTALAEYKLIFNRYPHHDTASYAIYESSKIKAKLGDYTGVKDDLNELLTLHPDSKIIDMATLSLAQTSYASKNYNQAAMLFSKVYTFDTSRAIKSAAAIGAGLSFFKLKSHDQAQKCILKGIELYEKQDDTDICEAYYTLGISYIETKNLTNAGKSFTKALEQKGLPHRRIAQISIKKALVELDQGNETESLKTLEGVKVEQLSQEMTTDLLIAKSTIYRHIGLSEKATILLRHKIEYMPKKELRARMAIELSKSYSENGQNEFARRELVRAISLLPINEDMCLANLELASVSIKIGNYDDAISACKTVLSLKDFDKHAQKASSLLAQAYNKKGLYKEAAAVLSGTMPLN